MSLDIFHTIASVAAATLACAGLAKLRAPAPAEQALRAQGIAAPRGSGRVVGTIEIAVGVTALAAASPATAAALGVVYLAFAAFVARAARRGTPCGCLGASPRAADPLQAAVDLAFAGAAFGSAVNDPISLLDLARATPNGAIYLALVALGTVLALQAIGPLGELRGLARPGARA